MNGVKDTWWLIRIAAHLPCGHQWAWYRCWLNKDRRPATVPLFLGCANIECSPHTRYMRIGVSAR